MSKYSWEKTKHSKNNRSGLSSVGERQTEDLEAMCSIHIARNEIYFFATLLRFRVIISILTIKVTHVQKEDGIFVLKYKFINFFFYINPL